jgi:hypothetical protein
MAPLLLTTLFSLLLAQFVIGATPSGPTAVISIRSASAFATMKPCARKCLSYEGVYYCGLAGYSDLGTNLGCGCSPQNFCYCDVKAAASASSYISSCVNGGCGTDFPAEVTSAISLYDGYCATANVAAQTTVQDTSKSSITSISVTSLKTSPANTVVGEQAQTTSVTTTQDSGTASSEKKGLSQSDVIAIGVGLGVGVPSLVLGIATFCLARRKKDERAG